MNGCVASFLWRHPTLTFSGAPSHALFGVCLCHPSSILFGVLGRALGSSSCSFQIISTSS